MFPAHLAARQLAEVRFEILPDDGIDGNKAEHTSFPYTALRVIITLHCTKKEYYNQHSFKKIKNRNLDTRQAFLRLYQQKHGGRIQEAHSN